MPLFRRDQPQAASPPPPPQLPDNTDSPFLNVLSRELNAVLPKEKIVEIRSQLTATREAAPEQDRLRAFLALDWLTHAWLGRWCAVLARDEQFAAALPSLPPIRDLHTAGQTGDLVHILRHNEITAADHLAQNYRDDNFYDMATVSAARQASSSAPAKAAGSAFADAAASTLLDECLAARADRALSAVRTLSFMYCLDEVWKHMTTWAAGPGSFDVKKLNINNLAPAAAWYALQPVTGQLLDDAARLYLDLHRMR
ncbi:hypothetical protein [Lentzea aerocolonigenes]|uniref:hypothetical protein n=1 Tax=Lentzea aerocolonigenes TaxID=68170 RepID=UPI0012E1BDD8|nr:hypothetical protein [Lentzea aerocolonigenes]